jgi:aspartyl-tRNA(Asn)/glutamyl-tRNA(Gln) amidotransferase subunit C
LRADQVTESDQRTENMQSAPAQQDGYFLVPKVIE